jgi:hypothetical protein
MPEHTLPRNPRAAVIEWRTAGGGGGAETTTDLVVRADGSVTVGGRLAGGRPIEGSIAPRRLRELLDAVVDEGGFFDIDPAALAAQLDAARERREAAGAGGDTIGVPLGPPYVDAGESAIVVEADGRRHEVTAQGLAAAAREYPEVPALARLRGVELELLRLAEELTGRRPP